MDREILRQMLREKLENDTGEPVASMDDSVNLRTDLKLDSIDLVSLIIHLQSEHGIIMEPEELAHVTQVGQLLDVVGAKFAQQKCQQAA